MSRIHACLPLIALLALASGASAAEPPAPLAESALAQVRGGYFTAEGISFDFGAEVRTFVDDKLALESRLSLGDAGLAATHAAGAGLSIGADGLLTLPGEGGATRVLHALGGDQLASVVLNTASNRDIRQDTALTVVVPGLDALQQQISLQRLGAQLSAAGGAGTLTRLGQ
jgi:hypothetical protein